MNRKIYYGALGLLVAIALIFNLKTSYRPINDNISLMYIKIAEKLADKKMYNVSSFYYRVAQKVSKHTEWLDFQIATNIIYDEWGKPLTPYKEARLNQALELLNKESALHPNHSHIYARYAYAYYELEDYDNSIVYYEKCVKKDPKWEYGWQRLAYIYDTVKKDYPKALECVNKAMELSDDNELNFSKALILSDLDRKKEAIEYYKKYLENNPTSVAALVNISSCEISVKDWENAKKHVELGLKYNRYSSYLISNKIDILLHEHKFDEAKNEANAMLERNSDNGWEAYPVLAKIERYNGNNDEAEKYYKLAKENAQEYFDKYCDGKDYDVHDIDAKCSNRSYFLENFEKNKAKPLDF